MKRNLILSCLIFLINLIIVGFLILKSPFLYVYIGLLMVTVLSAFSIFEAIKNSKMMDFLVQDNKKNKQRSVQWNQEEEEKLGVLKRRVEISALQSQINPHFLYNTLDSIRSKALLDGHREIASMTEILSKFFRYCISNDESLVKIREEINHINDYYYIQRYRFEDRVNMEIYLESEDINDYYVPKMTLQPLVENAMIHGLEKLAAHGKIIIRVKETERKVVITISDNGKGMNQEQLEALNNRMEMQLVNAETIGKRHNGIALTNVNSRIKITFGEEYGIHYRSIENGGTDAIITIPKIDEFRRVKYEDLFGNRR
jgi:sensor histidine kinase YesM